MRRESNSGRRPDSFSRFALPLSLLLFLFLFSLPLFAETDTGTVEPKEAILSYYVNGRSIGDRPSFFIGDELQVPLPLVEEALLPLLDPPVSVDLRSAARKDAVGARFLQEKGIQVDYDEALLQVQLTVPARLMAVSYLGSRKESAPVKLPTKYPSSFSAIVNSSFQATGTSYESGNPSALLGDTLDIALNFRDWVAISQLELEASRQNAPDPEWLTTSDLVHYYVVRDLRSAGARMTIGTVDLPWRTLLARHAAVGIVVDNNEDVLLPNSRGTPQPRAFADVFTVDTPAQVTVIVNGTVVFSSQVAPGRYRFSDLPFATGLNEAEIAIDERGKPLRSYKLGVPFDGTALRKGESDYSMGFGLDEGTMSEPIFSFYADQGVSDFVSAGTSLQVGYRAALFSYNASLATLIGNFSVEGGLSVDPAGDWGFGYALIGHYRYMKANKPNSPRVGIGARFLWPGFTQPLAVRSGTADAFSWSLVGQVVHPTRYGFSFTYGAENSGNVEEPADLSAALSVGLNMPLEKGTTLMSGISIHAQEGTIAPEAYVTIHIIPSGGQSSMIVRQNLVGGESGASISLNHGQGPGALSVDFNLDNAVSTGESPQFIGGSVRRTGHYGDLSVSAGTRDGYSDSGRQSYIAVESENALVFAEGLLAPSRRVGDSFVLLAPDSSFASYPVEMNSGGDRALIPPGGKPKVGTLLSSYSEGYADIDTPGSPPDISVKESRIRLSSTYKSGIVVRPSRSISIYAAGRLVDAAGNPVQWMLGTAVGADGIAFGEFFTDDSGIFELYGLSPGQYTVSWADERLPPLSFTVPIDADGGIDLGTVGAVSAEGAME